MKSWIVFSRSVAAAAVLATVLPWGAAFAGQGNVSDITGGNVSDITGGNVSDITGGNVSDITGISTADAQVRADLAEKLGQAYAVCVGGGDCGAFYALFDQVYQFGR